MVTKGEPTQRPSILAVIPSIAVGGFKSLEKLYKSLESCPGVNPVVMSNAERLSLDLEGAGISFLTQYENAGFGSSIDFAATRSNQWDWLLIVNDDIEIDLPLFECALDRHLTVEGARSPRILYFDEENARRIPTRLDVVLQVSLVGSWLSKKVRLRAEEARAYRSFSCVAISRQLWTVLSGFDKSLPFTYEDADFVRRAYDAGFEQNLAYDSGIVHKHSISSGNHVSVVLPVATCSGALYLDKWYGHQSFNTVLIMGALLVRLLVVPFARASTAAHLSGIANSLVAVLKRRSQMPKLPLYGDL